MESIKDNKNTKSKTKSVKSQTDWLKTLEISNAANEDLKEIWEILLTSYTLKVSRKRGKRNENKNELVKGKIIFANNSKATKTKSHFDNQITYEDLQKILLQKRAEKGKLDQKNRTKENAEVFTPLWVCNKQNDLVDQEWFCKKSDLFLAENNEQLLLLLDKEGWEKYQEYILLPRMEITCGEAPYLVSRYDVTDSNLQINPINSRIGLLDRKLRIINHFIAKENKDEWIKWVTKAFQSIYGFEYQGDNLLLARINLFNTFCDYYKDKFNQDPSILNDKKLLIEVAKIISWNLWQMDGIEYCVPYSNNKSSKKEVAEDNGAFNEDWNDKIAKAFNNHQKEDDQNSAQFCIIKDWFLGKHPKDNKNSDFTDNLDNTLYFKNFMNTKDKLKADELKQVGKLSLVVSTDNN